MRIRAQLSVFTSLLVLGTVAVISAVTYTMESELIDAQVASRRATQVSTFAEVCRLAVSQGQLGFLDSYIRYAASMRDLGEDVAYAYYVGEDRRIRVHTDKRFAGRPFSGWAAHKPPGVAEEYVPISVGGKWRGTAVIGFSGRLGTAYKWKTISAVLSGVLNAGTLVSLIAILLAMLLGYYITRPLKDLVRGFEEVGKGNFETVVIVSARNELRELATHFNWMAQRLNGLNRFKEELVNAVSHDLRNPINAIAEWTNYLVASDPNRDKLLPSQREQLRIIQDLTKRLNVYATNILDNAKMNAGAMEYHIVSVDARDLAESVSVLFEHMARNRSIALETDIPPGLRLLADPQRLEHVLNNLVSNAVKFTPEGGRIVLSARAEGGRAELSVADTGRGIPPEELPGLFEPFYQAELARQRRQRIQGTGLGLSIVKRTVEGMSGAISVESEVGKGTRFKLTFPLAPEPVSR